MSKIKSIRLYCALFLLLMVSINGYALTPMGIIALQSNWGIWLTDHMNNFGRAKSLFESLSEEKIPTSGNVVELFNGEDKDLSISCKSNIGFDGSQYLACELKIGKNAPIDAKFGDNIFTFASTCTSTTSKKLYDKLRVKTESFGDDNVKIATSSDKRLQIHCSQYNFDKKTEHTCFLQVTLENKTDKN